MFEALIDPDYGSWHARARALVQASVHPDQVIWVVRGEQMLLPDLADPSPNVADTARLRVPRRFVALAQLAACHRASERWALLYRVLWRLARDNPRALDDELDPDVARLSWLARQVNEDVHRMKAFVRLRRVGREGSERFVGWYAPDHDIVALAAPHFVERYRNLRWSIFTPWRSAHWDGAKLTLGAGVPRDALPAADSDEAVEALWRRYYAAAFNPARANERKLRRDMPPRFWKAMPEAAAIPALLAGAAEEVSRLRAGTGGCTDRSLVPDTADVDVLRNAAAGCRGCDLFGRATQTVFGEGRRDAPIMLVGEQPGDVEDRTGRPFVGPAGQILDRALDRAGIQRGDAYVTNAVKHFAWEERGKRRIHRTPQLAEVRACRPWLEAEIAAVRPRVIVCLGGTAAQALLGPQARVNALRGRVLDSPWAPALVVTSHPSAILRAEPAAQDAAFAALVADLHVAAGAVAGPPAGDYVNAQPDRDSRRRY